MCLSLTVSKSHRLKASQSISLTVSKSLFLPVSQSSGFLVCQSASLTFPETTSLPVNGHSNGSEGGQYQATGSRYSETSLMSHSGPESA